MQHLKILEQALEDLAQGNYETACKALYDNDLLNVLNDKDAQYVNRLCKQALKAGVRNEWVYIMICTLHFDHSFENDDTGHEEMLEWAREAIVINSNNFRSQRNAGSALYWLDDWDAAFKYYQKSNEIKPQPDL